MICPFDSNIHCMCLEDARDHNYLFHPECPDCPHYNGGEEVDHPQYVGFKAYAIMFGIFAGAGIFSCALIYVLYGIIFGW